MSHLTHLVARHGRRWTAATQHPLLAGVRDGTSALPGAQGYAELVEHWTTPGFAEYVAALQALSEHVGPPDEDLVAQVLDQEAAFWQMAFEGAAA